MSAVVGEQVLDRATVRQSRVLAIFSLFVGAFICLVFARGAEPGQMVTFGMNPGRTTAAIRIPDVTLPVLPTLYALAALAIGLGIFQLVRGPGRPGEGAMLAIVSFALVFAFLTWAARGKGLNLEGLLETAVQRAVPIALAALSGVLCERSGIVNIAIEGMMLTAACCSALVGSVAKNLWVALIVSVLVSGLLGALLAVLSIRFKVNQIISGTAINILATGGTSFVSARFLSVYQELNNPGKFPNMPIPGLSRIPILGPMFFESNIIVYMMFVLLLLIHFMLYYTPWGLRTRAVGEHPRAADTLGVNVFLIRYVNVILGGMVAGLGGVFLVLGSVPRFDELMTAGKGFIGLAALIFGKWNPFGAFGASLIFGFTDTFQAKLQILRVPIPSQFLRMAPYLITMVVLAGVVGRAVPPAAEGQPYEKQ
ncbi:MAG: ABC transporter permease [Anaerolineae bacterium]|nr:ABC transporter permease [Anaerolineae bacterium]